MSEFCGVFSHHGMCYILQKLWSIRILRQVPFLICNVGGRISEMLIKLTIIELLFSNVLWMFLSTIWYWKWTYFSFTCLYLVYTAWYTFFTFLIFAWDCLFVCLICWILLALNIRSWCLCCRWVAKFWYEEPLDIDRSL
jgi:hypothetical protein